MGKMRKNNVVRGRILLCKSPGSASARGVAHNNKFQQWLPASVPVPSDLEAAISHENTSS